MQKRISLNGLWEFSEDIERKEWMQGYVPGCVQLDLLKVKKLKDPFYRLNEKEVYFLEEKNWIYRKTFNFNLSLKKDFSFIYLVFEGIDTYSDIYLNSNYIGSTENMFIPYRFNITKFLKDGENILEVYLKSIVKTASFLKEKDKVGANRNTYPIRSYVRKAQYSFGWDWAPQVVQIGIWKDVYLELLKDAKILNPFFITKKIMKNNDVLIETGAEIERFTKTPLKFQIDIYFNKNKIISYKNKVKKNIIKFKTKINSAQLWFPNNSGMPNLYDIEITLFKDNIAIDKIEFKSGIRKVKLIRKKDEEGETFIFEINGKKIFAKGANWVPADSLLPRLTNQDYEKYIKLAKEANMNMLRVWGGGIYENEIFYQLCDKYGIMVWQDFMYACAEYPDHLKWFRNLAKREADLVIKKLRIHPSIVLWCGNNENNVGFISWWKFKKEPKYSGNYIYKKILPKLCLKNDGSRPYWISSPYGGKDPNSQTAGDRHNWDVWHGWRSFEDYLNDKGRFISEFGIIGAPSLKTIEAFTKPFDRKIFSAVIQLHEKSYEGITGTLKYLVEYLGFPKDFKSFCYLSQINQAEGVRIGVEHFRSRKFKTAGALFWQFNDCWPVLSWACIDYYKRKKALYYYAKKFFDDILITIKNENKNILIYGINDKFYEVSGKLSIKTYDFYGKILFSHIEEIKLPANDVLIIKTFPEEKIRPVEECVVFVKFQTSDGVYTNYKLFKKIRDINLPRPNIQIKKRGNIIELKSDKPAFGVVIESKNEVDFSDNFLNIEPNVVYKIKTSPAVSKINIFTAFDMIKKI